MAVKIVLDPGHGGKDPGAVGTANGASLYEKDVVLFIAKYAEDYLETYYQVTSGEVTKTRSNDESVSLEARSNYANGQNADCFVSLHMNASTDRSVRGFESYRYLQTDQRTLDLQSLLHVHTMDALAEYGIVIDRGMKRADFHVLRETNMPACLLEIGFIS
ncbi:MAG: N-acetylmuramoyl-L-alanine amidase, partial [Bacilli bacterium]